MAFRISMGELGLANDHTVIEGDTPGDVWRRVQEYLKDKHKIKLPAMDNLGGEGIFPAVTRFDNASVAGQQGPVVAPASHVARGDDDTAEARMIATRLLEKLHVGQQGSGSSDTIPPGGTSSPMP
jgi:hypothetical protein